MPVPQVGHGIECISGMGSKSTLECPRFSLLNQGGDISDEGGFQEELRIHAPQIAGVGNPSYFSFKGGMVGGVVDHRECVE